MLIEHRRPPVRITNSAEEDLLLLPDLNLEDLNSPAQIGTPDTLRGKGRFFSWATKLMPSATTIKHHIPEIAAGIAASSVVKYGVQGAMEFAGIAGTPLVGATAGGIMALGREYFHNRALTEAPPKREPLPIPAYLREQRLKGRLDDSFRNRLTADNLVKPRMSDILMDSLQYNWDIIKKTRVREIAKGVVAGAAGGVIAGVAIDMFSFAKDLVNLQLPKIELPNLPSLSLPEISFPKIEMPSLPNPFQATDTLKPDVAQIAGTTQEYPSFGTPPSPDRWYLASQSLANSKIIPDSIQLHAGSSLTEETMAILDKLGDKLDLSEKNQIIVEVAKQSGVYVPGWPETKGVLHTMLRPGYELVFNEPVKAMINKFVTN